MGSYRSLLGLLIGRSPDRKRPVRHAGFSGRRLAVESLERRQLLSVTIGSVVGQGTILDQQDAFVANIQSNVVGGAIVCSGQLSFSDAKANDTFNAVSISSISIGAPTGPAGTSTSNYFNIAGTATLNGSTGATYSFTAGGSLPYPSNTGSTGGVGFTVTGPNGFSYSTPWKPWDPGQSIVVTGTPATPTSTVTTLTSSANPSVYSQPVTFTATVGMSPASSNPVTGTVSFIVDGGTPVNETVSGGKATYTTYSLGLGTHTVEASYGGATLLAPSQDSIVQTVNQASSATTLSYSGSFAYGQPLTLTAAVAGQSPAYGRPTGNVTFYDGTSVLGTVAIAAGTTSTNAATLFLPTGLAVGTHTLSAVYGGDTNFLGSTSATISKTVAAVTSTTQLTASANPVTAGTTVTFTAKVSEYTTGTKLATLPTGTVTFSDGSTVLGTIPLDATGTAQCSTSFTVAGSHTIVASYSGDSIYGPSSTTLAEMVQATTAMQLISSANPSVYSQPVTFTAAVTTADPVLTSGGTPASATVGGTVTFTVDQGTPVSVTLSGGKATFTTYSLGLGTHSVVAAYAGTSLFTASQATVSQVVNQANSVTTLSYSGSFAVGQPLTLTAAVAGQSPAYGRPTGNVTFYDGTSILGTVAIAAGTTSTNAATLFLPSGLGVGTHTLSAVYGGDTNFFGSTSATISKTVTAVASTTQLTASANPVTTGKTVVFTAKVSEYTTGTKLATLPTGTVTFSDGSTVLGTIPLDATGTAQCSTSFTVAGSHSIVASYSGDSIYSSSSTTLSEMVQATTAMQLTSSANPSVFSQPVTFTAAVTTADPVLSSGGTPASATVGGTVTFTVDQGTPVSVTLSGGKATFTTSSLGLGTHSVVATYAGTSLFTASQATVSQLVNQANSVTTLSYSGSFVYGQPLTLTAAVAGQSPAYGRPTGNVTFYDGTSILGTVAIVSGTNSINSANAATLSLPNGLSIGTHTLSAVYGGDTNFLGSTSATITKIVTAVASTTQLTASANPVTTGTTVIFTAKVSQYTTETKLATIPTGTVTFSDGKTVLGTITLDATGTAQCAAAFTAAGSHTIVASYSGDSIYSSSSTTLAEMVKATTAMQLTSSANPSVFSQPVTFTAAVTTADPVLTSGGTPASATVGGTVTFTVDQGTPVSVTLSGGKATFTTCSLGLGTHSVVAAYAGTSLFTASQATVSQVVNQANSVTTLSYSGSFTYGQPLTLTAGVAGQSPAYGRPTGNVTFYDGTSVLGTVAIVAGTTSTNSTNAATLPLPSGLSIGTHTLSAVYGGDTNFLGSTSATISKTVSPAVSTTQLTASANPVTTGTTVIFTAKVSQYTTETKLATLPTGTVTFSDGSTVLGTITLDATGTAQCSASFTVAGSHAIVAVYSGDSIYGPSEATLYLAVSQQLTTINSPQTVGSLDASSNLGFVIDGGGDLTVNSPISLDSGGEVSLVQSGQIAVPGINTQPNAIGLSLNNGTLRECGF